MNNNIQENKEDLFVVFNREKREELEKLLVVFYKGKISVESSINCYNLNSLHDHNLEGVIFSFLDERVSTTLRRGSCKCLFCYLRTVESG